MQDFSLSSGEEETGGERRMGVSGVTGNDRVIAFRPKAADILSELQLTIQPTVTLQR